MILVSVQLLVYYLVIMPFYVTSLTNSEDLLFEQSSSHGCGIRFERVQSSYTEDSQNRRSRSRVSQRGFRVDSAPSLSSTSTAGPVENRLRFLLTSEQHALNLISPGRIDQSLLISLLPFHVQGFMIYLSLMMCYQVFACMHFIIVSIWLRFELVFQGIGLT